MNKIEFAKLADWIKTCYPREELLPNKAALAIWYEELKDLDFDIALAAVRKHTQTSKWSPTIADIRSAAADIATPDSEAGGWSDGWKKACRAISTFGYYREAEALAALDHTTRETVRRLGWKQLCISTNPAADRANFRQVYEQVEHRRIEAATLSVSLRDVIEAAKQEKLANESERLLIPD